MTVRVKNIDGGYDQIELYNVNDYSYPELPETCKYGRQGETAYMTEFGTFDIETSSYIDQDGKLKGVMYIWQMCIGGTCVSGRTWAELMTFWQNLIVEMELTKNRRFVIYVHNLGFEYQFVKKFIKTYFGNYKVFAVGSRKPLRIECECGLEFRCSWKLSNMNLKKYLENMQVRHPKADGDLDYRIMRLPCTPLTDEEMGYCVSDVLGLYEAISINMTRHGDDLHTIPMTSTGYVRRDVRKACNGQKGYHLFLQKNALSKDVYQLLNEMARGGNTHASRHASGRTWKNAKSYDSVSSYLYQLVAKQYPMSPWTYRGKMESMDQFRRLQCEGWAMIMRITMTGVELKRNTSMPYLPYAKCVDMIGTLCDNGRILCADALTLACNDIDFKIIDDQYVYKEIWINDVYTSTYGYLPDAIRDKIREYFTKKTTLKGIEESKYEYDHSKKLANAIFGMMFTDCVRRQWSEDEEGRWSEEKLNDAQIEKKLAKYNMSRNTFLNYSWGVWCPSHARDDLQMVIDTFDDNGIALYCDTDSVKGILENTDYIRVVNQKIEYNAYQTGAYCDYDGKRHYMGVFELDGKYRTFKTLGAKKYAYEDDKGFSITVSGVEKLDGAKEMGDISKFDKGFVFEDAGGIELHYNEDVVHYVTLSDHRGMCESVQTASNIGIKESTYTLGLTDEYEKLINYIIGG